MKHTIKGYITYEKPVYSEKPVIGFYTFKPSPEHFPDMVVVREHSFEVEVPDDFDPRPDMIASLRAQEKKAMANFELKVNQIRKQISELQAIELSPEAT